MFSLSLLFAVLITALEPDASPETPAATPIATLTETSADLSPILAEWKLSRRNQKSRPTCSVFVIVQAIEFAARKERGTTARLSVEYANWAKNQAAWRVDDGGFFSVIWRGFEQHGICEESLFPYQDAFDPQRTPSEEAVQNAELVKQLSLRFRWIKRWNPQTGLNDRQFARVKEALRNGAPVCVGMRWTKRPVWSDGVMSLVPAADVFDGHSVLFVGYQDDDAVEGGGYFIFRNTNYPRREQKMSFAYAKEFTNDAGVVVAEPAP